jgi:hypothetical protein
MPSIILFTDISEPEIVFLNRVYDYLEQKGVTLRAVVFKDFHGCVKKLKCEYIYLKTSSLFNLALPARKKRDFNAYDDDFLQKLILLEKEISKNREIDVTAYEYNLNSLVRFVENLTKVASTCFVMSRSYTAYKVVKSVLANKKIDFIPFEKWVFAGSYQFNRHGIHQPRLDGNLKVDDERQYSLLLQKLLSNFKGRHHVSEKKTLLPNNYVLLLLGDGCSGSYCLKDVEEYWTVGKGWGNDFEVTSKVEKCIQRTLPDSKLLVRQHPYTKYKFDKRHIDSQLTMLANNVELDSLVSNAYITIAAPGSTSYYSLAKGKRPIILGNGELCSTQAVKCVDSVDELGDYISAISKNKQALVISREDVIKAVMPYFKNQIWVNDETFTYRVLDKYIDSEESAEDKTLIWRRERTRVLKYQIFVYIKNKFSAIYRKVKKLLKILLMGK